MTKSYTIIKNIILNFICLSITSVVHAHLDLVDIYKLAEKNDPLVKEQWEVFNATKQELPIERSDLLPQINLDGSRGYTKIQRVSTDVELYNKTYNLILEQILFDWAEWQEYLRTTPVITAAEKNWYLANQDLILRVSEAYINILNAEDTLSFTDKEYEAINELYQESKARFDVGEITRADIDQVKADLDAVTAELHVARAEVLNNRDRLSEIINKDVAEIAPLKNNPKIIRPNPRDVKKWLEIAREYNLNLQIAHANRLIAEHDIKIAEAGYMPRVTADARLRGSDSRRLLFNVISPTQEFINTFRVGVDITSPNLNPYRAIHSTKKAKYDYHRTDKEYLEEYRRTEKLIKQYYRDTINNEKRIRALKQAVKAAQSALDANRENFEIGTRTYVIVLDRISELYQAQRDYRDAVYQYILSLLRLEGAAGRLNIKDLIAVNNLLYNHRKINKKSNV